MSLLACVLLLSSTPTRVRALPLSGFGLSNDGSTVVGFIDRKSHRVSRRLPCYWTRSDGLRRLSIGAYESGEARKASIDGKVIVGLLSRGGRDWIAVWSRGSQPTIIAQSGPPWAMGFGWPDISGDGNWVVGSTNGKAFRWSRKTGLQFLEPLNPRFAKAVAERISLDGSTIIGESNGGPIPKQVEQARLEMSSIDIRGVDAYQACFWHPPVGTRSLGEVRGAPWTLAVGVSSDGSIIAGNSMADEGNHPFLWSRTGGIRLLPDFPKATTWITGMTTDGRIVYGDTSPANHDLRSFPSLWLDGRLMRFEAYLRARDFTLPRGWTVDYIRGMSKDGRVIVGDSYVGGKAVSWIAG